MPNIKVHLHTFSPTIIASHQRNLFPRGQAKFKELKYNYIFSMMVGWLVFAYISNIKCDGSFARSWYGDRMVMMQPNTIECIEHVSLLELNSFHRLVFMCVSLLCSAVNWNWIEWNPCLFVSCFFRTKGTNNGLVLEQTCACRFFVWCLSFLAQILWSLGLCVPRRVTQHIMMFEIWLIAKRVWLRFHNSFIIYNWILFLDEGGTQVVFAKFCIWIVSMCMSMM